LLKAGEFHSVRLIPARPSWPAEVQSTGSIRSFFLHRCAFFYWSGHSWGLRT